MRLTLRTLLAYRDRVLNATEIEDMHGRVQQSAMAANLLKRIESLIHRPTILAPPVEGQGLGADANSIAEYLDDSLKGDKVPELERICLESDVQLAELAQCHQLLSAALSTAVDVPEALRERINALSDPGKRAQEIQRRSESNASDNTATAPKTTAEPTATATAASAKTGASRFKEDDTALAAGSAESHATASHSSTSNAREHGNANGSGSKPGHTAVDDQKDKTSKRMVVAQPVEAPMVASGGHSIKPTGLDLEGSHLAHEVPEYLRGRSHDGWTGPLAIGGLLALLALLVWQSIGSWKTVQDMFANKTPNTNVLQGEDATRDKPSDSETPTNVAPSNAAVADSGTKPQVPTDAGSPVPNANPSANANANANTTAVAPEPNSATPVVPMGSNANPQPAITPNVPPASPLAPDRSEPYAAEWLPTDPQAMKALLFVQKTNDDILHRMQAAERLPSGARIVVPPATRPQLDLSNGTRWTVCGHSQLSVASPNENSGRCQLELRLGRGLLSASEKGKSIELIARENRVLIDMSDSSTVLAVALDYVPLAYAPVIDPKAVPAVINIYAVAGSAQIKLAASSPTNGEPTATQQLAAGQSLQCIQSVLSQPQNKEAPGWIDPTSDRPVDVLAIEDLDRQLANTEELGSTLQKLVGNRRPETRAMTAMTLSLLGSWDWIFNERCTLNDGRDRSYWKPLLDLTRQILAANPQQADALKALLIKQDPQRGPARWTMWVGQTQSELEKDGLSTFVAHLDSEVLLDRILAIYCLEAATGKDLGYQAGDANRASIQQWKRELATGNIKLLPIEAKR